ncbi:MAG: glyoxylate/hydroxypyruvate reductase A [Balneolaceae bacterium]
MSILLVATNRDMVPHRDKLLELDPNLDVEIWPDVKDRDRITFIVAWSQPANLLGQFPNLKVVASMGAGVEHLMEDDSIPDDVKITRLVSSHIQVQIVDFIESCCYQFIRRITDYVEQQRKAEWKVLPHALKEERNVGILGLGHLGAATAEKLAANGWIVNGWSRSTKQIPGCISYAGPDQLAEFLSKTNILVNLLPLTPETEGILNLELFKQLKQPACLINTGRGQHLVEEDLIYALDRNLLKEAYLDVFETEPLPASHPFWNRPAIRVTPHIASLTYPEELAGQTIDNYKRLMSGQPLLYVVDREKGY